MNLNKSYHQISLKKKLFVEWNDYWDIIPLEKFRPYKDKGNPLRKLSSGQVYHYKQQLAVRFAPVTD